MKPSGKRLFATVALVVLLIGVTAYSQRPGRGGGRRGGAGRSGAAALDGAFRGIATNGEIEKGLYSIKSTGVSTALVVDAAEAFISALSDEQRARTMFPVDDKEWRLWDNRHFYKRQGVGFDEMDDSQRDLAFGLMKASLSARGLKQSQDIMKLNGTLAELANNFHEYGEWLYWITIMGTPSATEPWGWQIDGHHLIINYFVLGDQVVMSPVFVGSEPVHAYAGKFKGTVVMQSEQDKGLALMQALRPDQQRKAQLARVKNGNNAVAQAYRDNIDLEFSGLPASEMDDQQRALLIDVISEFVGYQADGHAKVKMSEVSEHIDRTYFAWVGDSKDDSVFYYRIHSPVVLIEFDHQRRVAPPQARGGGPTREHIHAVLRTPNGNDYGKDLLRQHIENHHADDHTHKH